MSHKAVLKVCLAFVLGLKLINCEEYMQTYQDIPGEFYKDVCKAEKCTQVQFLMERKWIHEGRKMYVGSSLHQSGFCKIVYDFRSIYP